MQEAVWSHIQEWVELYKEQFGKLPELGQLTAFVEIFVWGCRPVGDAAEEDELDEE